MAELEGNPYFDLIRAPAEAGPGLRTMADVIARRVANQWSGDREMLRRLQHLLNRIEALFWDSADGRFTPHVRHVAEVCRERRGLYGRGGARAFEFWIASAVGDLLYADGSLTREEIALLLGVNRKSLSRSARIRELMKSAKDRRRMNIPKGAKADGQVEAVSPI